MGPLPVNVVLLADYRYANYVKAVAKAQKQSAANSQADANELHALLYYRCYNVSKTNRGRISLSVFLSMCFIDKYCYANIKHRINDGAEAEKSSY